MTIFKNEYKIREIGGLLEKEYYSFRNSVLVVNMDYIPLFFMLGIKDRDLIIDSLLSDDDFRDSAKSAYIAQTTQKIADGDISIDSLLTKNTINKEFSTHEAKQQQIDREINRTLTRRFRDIYNRYLDIYKPSPLGFSKIPIKICRESLVLAELGFEIDVNIFISLYRDRMKASESELHQLHIKAANALNEFFRGLVITQKELERFFIIESGLIMPNPESINLPSYMRLGIRGKQKKK